MADSFDGAQLLHGMESTAAIPASHVAVLNNGTHVLAVFANCAVLCAVDLTVLAAETSAVALAFASLITRPVVAAVEVTPAVTDDVLPRESEPCRSRGEHRRRQRRHREPGEALSRGQGRPLLRTCEEPCQYGRAG